MIWFLLALFACSPEADAPSPTTGAEVVDTGDGEAVVATTLDTGDGEEQ